MKETDNAARVNIGGLVALVLFLGMFIYLAIVMNMRTHVEEELRKEKLHAELLLSEKLHEEKKNNNLREDLIDLQRKISEEKQNLDSALRLLGITEAKVATKNSNENSFLIERQQHEIDRLKQQANRDSTEHASAIESVESERKAVEAMLFNAMSDNERYVSEIERLNRLRVSDAMIQPVKNKTKPTVKAAKTKFIKLNAVISDLHGNLSFKIIDPSGVELPVDPQNFTIKTEALLNEKVSEAFFVDNSIRITASAGAKKVEITYKPARKLAPGKYKTLLYSADGLIGSLALSLE